MAETKKLFDQFAPVTPEEWRAKAEVDLKGADFEKKMVWRTNEGFNAQPLSMCRPPTPRLSRCSVRASTRLASTCMVVMWT